MTTADPVTGDRLVVPVSLVPLRSDATHRSELVSQWIIGETITVLEREGAWFRGRGADGYIGWTPAAPFRRSAFTADEWDEMASHYSVGTAVAGEDAPGLRRLPWGAQVAIAESGSGEVVLPDGGMTAPATPDRIIPRSVRFDPAVAVPTAVQRAREWSGVPYLWGGRTEFGVDCSGFVQAVFAAAGLALPRDSHEQAAANTDLQKAGSGGTPRPADLLFFAPEGGAVTHVAMSLGGTRIIHAASGNGVVREDDLRAEDALCSLLARSIIRHTRPVAGRAPAQP